MSSPLRAAIVGASGIGKHHAKWLHALGAEVCAIVGTSDETLAKAATGLREIFPFAGACYTSLPAMLAQADPDLVHVCTPPHLHHEHMMMLAAHRCHVLCEKPLTWDEAKPAAQLAQAGWERIVYLGSGPYYGLACEGMLKAKEMGLAWSEAYHFPELRHGPLALVDERTLVIGLLSDAGGRVEQAVLADARELGAITLAIGDQPPDDLARHTIALRTGLSDQARGALYLLPLQLLAVELAHARGLDPDAPRHLQPAVVLEGV